MRMFYKMRMFALGILLLSLFNTNSLAEGLIFGLAGKSIDDINFIAAWNGCAEEAEKFGDRCLHIGEKGAASFRYQNRAIEQAIEQGLDGLAISVTNSEFLATHALKKAVDADMPIITFDSDLEPDYVHLRRAYVGANNLEFGRDLGSIAKRFRPQGGSVCLMSGGQYNPNLNERLLGIRQVLSGNDSFSEDKKLAGEGGWLEPSRCPWYNRDKLENALAQMEVALTDIKVDVFISVGAWPQIDLAKYRAMLTPLKADYFETNKQIIIIGIGKALPEQLDMLKERLAHAYVSLDFEEMGRLSYRYLKKLTQGEEIPEITYTGNTVYLYTDGKQE